MNPFFKLSYQLAPAYDSNWIQFPVLLNENHVLDTWPHDATIGIGMLVKIFFPWNVTVTIVST